MRSSVHHNFAEHLLVLPVPMRISGGRMFFEQQACNGVDRWADHFRTLIVAAPCIPERLANDRGTMAWRDVHEIPSIDRIEFVPLPWATRSLSFARYHRQGRRVLRQLIARAHYLQFAPGSLWGDWATVAARQAHAMKRPYAVHLDCVGDLVVLQTAHREGWLKRCKARLLARLMRRWHHPAIARAALVLCHGRDTFQEYAPLNPRSFVIHNVHTNAADRVTPEQLQAKVSRATSPGPLTVCYAGRMAEEKAPLEWVRAIEHAIGSGADIRATWYGDGELRGQVEAAIARDNLGDRIRLPGFTADRQTVLEAMRQSDLLLFTHITPESPRCLLESLITGTPIVGYHSHFAEDLISGHAGGILTPMHEPAALGNALAELARDRSKLTGLIAAAARDGEAFTTDSVFRHRAELIKICLPPLSGPAGEPGAVGSTNEGVDRHRELSDDGADDCLPEIAGR